MSITSPTADQAEKRPCPVDTTSATSGSALAHGQRAARRARRLIGRPLLLGQRNDHRPVGQRVNPRAVLAGQILLDGHQPAELPGEHRLLIRPGAPQSSRGGVWPLQRRSPVADGPAMTTQAIRRSLAVSAAVGRPVRALPAARPSPRGPAPPAPPAPPRASGSRRSGSLASMLRHASSTAAGTCGASSRTRGASTSRILARSAVGASASNTARPVRHWNITQPSEKTSARGVMSRAPRTSSGAM